MNGSLLFLLYRGSFIIDFKWVKKQVLSEQLEWLGSSLNDCTSAILTFNNSPKERCFSSSGYPKSDFSHPIPTWPFLDLSSPKHREIRRVNTKSLELTKFK